MMKTIPKMGQKKTVSDAQRKQKALATIGKLKPDTLELMANKMTIGKTLVPGINQIIINNLKKL